MNRDGAMTSLWQQTSEYKTNKAGIKDEYDVLIVGGGITGLSTALRLQENGLQCIIAEANTLGFGTTGGTTAHINSFFDTPYSDVIKNFGEENAVLLYRGAEEAMNLIKSNIEKYNIDCSYDDRTAFLFSVDEKQNELLADIIKGGKQVGLPIDYTNENPFPIPYLKIAIINSQAQFNPILYIQGLARAFEAAGGTILENCRVTEVKEEEPLLIETSMQPLRAKRVIYATHIPPGVNILHFRCAPYRSYAIAAILTNKHDYTPFLGYDLDEPYHYYRMQNVNGQQYLIAGGEDHKTGHEENTVMPFEKLESHIKKFYSIRRVAFRWSSQYFEPADGLPYIGNLPGNSAAVYVATGFGGNGITYGSLSAIVLSDIISNGESKYQDLFDPNRLKPVAGFSNFIKENADVVKTFFTGKLSVEKINELASIAAGEGKIIKMDGHTAAVYKDENHKVYAVNPSCPHAYCSVAWNMAEKTWDCPCHGSRFSVEGKLLTGPAHTDLKHIDLTD